ncbi:MAG: HAD family hydrolase [Candidatus Bathyarchaeia archaeon]
MTIKAVLFDLGNTLVYQNPYKTIQKILETHGIIRTTKEIEKAFAKTEGEFDIEKHSRLPAHEFYTQLNIHILKHLGITNSNSLQALAEDINIQWFKVSKIYVYRDVKSTLAKLKKMGLKLGLITDDYRSDLEKILPKVGLRKFFDVCVCGDTVGKRKPNPRVFKHALNQLNIRASEAIFVGDRLDTDYLGAKNAGMTPILIRRESNKQEVAGVRCITSLKEVLKILEAIEGKALALN